jgi:PhoPQ-activated pathogenicity-related protein
MVMIDFLKADPLNNSRVEDQLIAWTWKEFIDTNGTDPRILLRFPMTKVEISKIK